MQHKVAEGLADAHICYFVLICISVPQNDRRILMKRERCMADLSAC